jgi:hypothetical protein
MQATRPIALLLSLGFLVSVVLLGKLTNDLGGLDPRFFYPAWAMFLFAFGIAGWNILAILEGRTASEPPRGGARALLVLAIPFAYVASVLDCMGLSITGCTDVCNALMRFATPAIILLSLCYLGTGMRAFLILLSVVPFAFLVPNCECRNPINSDWIDWLGRSPACFASSFGVTIIALSALHSGRRVTASIVACWTIVLGMLAFFVGHHYYHYPW